MYLNSDLIDYMKKELARTKGKRSLANNDRLLVIETILDDLLTALQEEEVVKVIDGKTTTFAQGWTETSIPR